MEDRLTTSLILLCAGATRMARTGGFAGADEPLDAAGRRDAERCALPDRYRAVVFASPMRAAVETAAAMGLPAVEDSALADADPGDWAGRNFGEIAPELLGGWLADATLGTPGGEAMTAVRERIGAWLDRLAMGDGPVTAITHATVIRAALAHALDLPLAATLRIDIAPLSHVKLSFNKVWRLQALASAP